MQGVTGLCPVIPGVPEKMGIGALWKLLHPTSGMWHLGFREPGPSCFWQPECSCWPHCGAWASGRMELGSEREHPRNGSFMKPRRKEASGLILTKHQKPHSITSFTFYCDKLVTKTNLDSMGGKLENTCCWKVARSHWRRAVNMEDLCNHLWKIQSTPETLTNI